MTDIPITIMIRPKLQSKFHLLGYNLSSLKETIYKAAVRVDTDACACEGYAAIANNRRRRKIQGFGVFGRKMSDMVASVARVFGRHFAYHG